MSGFLTRVCWWYLEKARGFKAAGLRGGVLVRLCCWYLRLDFDELLALWALGVFRVK